VARGATYACVRGSALTSPDVVIASDGKIDTFCVAEALGIIRWWACCQLTWLWLELTRPRDHTSSSLMEVAEHDQEKYPSDITKKHTLPGSLVQIQYASAYLTVGAA